jgi:hypothetical protein
MKGFRAAHKTQEASLAGEPMTRPERDRKRDSKPEPSLSFGTFEASCVMLWPIW